MLTTPTALLNQWRRLEDEGEPGGGTKNLADAPPAGLRPLGSCRWPDIGGGLSGWPTVGKRTGWRRQVGTAAQHGPPVIVTVGAGDAGSQQVGIANKEHHDTQMAARRFSDSQRNCRSYRWAAVCHGSRAATATADTGSERGTKVDVPPPGVVSVTRKRTRSPATRICQCPRSHCQ